ncbi:MAG TPA: hypothetical protein VFA57_18670 [Pseudolabrys sp.]|jgi:hypothetical protein|nr:hypothetical protein [Pseudolabrys sp.]
MTRRDDELLARQMRGITSGNEGLIGLTVLAVFVAGLAIGGIVFAPSPTRTPPHDAVAAVSSAPTTVQR